MQKDILVVEDSEERLKKITSFLIGYTYDIAPKANIAIDLLKTNTYDYVFLDHDLEEEHYETQCFGKGTGYEVAQFIVENKESIKRVILHSLNPVGRDRMLVLLKNAEYDVKSAPMFWDWRYGSLESILRVWNDR